MWIGHRKEFLSWRYEHYPFVIRTEEGLTLEASAKKLFTVANLHYQLKW